MSRRTVSDFFLTLIIVMLKIGLTGGIGSGKSTVARIFEVLGIPIYYADDAAKRLMHMDGPLKQQIKEHFGESIYEGNDLNKKQLAAIVFKSPEKLELLNSLIHPATIADAAKWMNEQDAPYTIKEAALIFESGSQQLLDFVIGVTAPAPLRIQRTMNRDRVTRDDVIARMDKQMDDSVKMKLCDFIIKNNEQEMLLPQVLSLHEKLLLLSNSK